jgi:hypothetical protein
MQAAVHNTFNLQPSTFNLQRHLVSPPTLRIFPNRARLSAPRGSVARSSIKR